MCPKIAFMRLPITWKPLERIQRYVTDVIRKVNDYHKTFSLCGLFTCNNENLSKHVFFLIYYDININKLC